MSGAPEKPGASQLTLHPRQWYAWHMVPGYVETPHAAPIRIDAGEPARQSRRTLHVRFWALSGSPERQDVNVGS